MGLLDFCKRHLHATGMILFFFIGLISYQIITIGYGVVNDSQTELGKYYQEYMLYMMIPVLCLSLIPFIFGLWFAKRRYLKDSPLRGDIYELGKDERRPIEFVD